MKTSTDLQGLFINALHDKVPKRHELVRIISETLKIEKESASRRLSGKVFFTVREIGILALDLGISLDSLLMKAQDYNVIPFKLGIPRAVRSMDSLIHQMELLMDYHHKVCKEPAEMGIIFDTLPMEFCVEYPYLCKLMYFKWGHYFIGTQEFNNFETWNMPDRLDKFHHQMMEIYRDYDKVTYIWDYAVIWNLVNDILYFSHIHALNKDDVEFLKQDLHNMMENTENLAKGIKKNSNYPEEIVFYISNVNIEIYCAYHFSAKDYFCFFKNYFMQSAINTDYQTCNNIREWINSMKKVSTLITDSGEKDRRLFFKTQHQYIEML